MANKLDDFEFCLPSHFLTDDESFMDLKMSDGGKCFIPGFNPFGPHSDLSSPVESVFGSVDTESDEDEYITGLIRKMAHSTFQNSGFGYGNSKGWSLSGSPQSTLYGCKQGSSHGSPNYHSQISSPPLVNPSDEAFDQFYAVAGEVARIRMMEEATRLWGMPSKASTENSKPSLGLLNYQQLQVAQFQRLKQQQMMKQEQVMLGLGKCGFGHYPVNQNQQQLAHTRGQNGVARHMNPSISGFPTLQHSQQQQHGSGMRAVFLGNPGPKRECTGTGVFLPRVIGTQTETRKKPGCSTVLLPDRVVQALNLNLEAMNARSQTQTQVQARCNQGGSGLTLSSGPRYPNNMAVAQQRRNLRTGNAYSQPASMSQELLLPQDWTY